LLRKVLKTVNHVVHPILQLKSPFHWPYELFPADSGITQNETLPAHYSTVDDDKCDNDTQNQGYQTGAQGSTQTARDESDSNSVDYGYDNCKPEHYLLTLFFTSKLSMSLNNTFFPGKNGRLRAIS